ncbi:MAG: aminoglycoside 6-adenylyltransferase [Gammaproteobacteria bacterium]|jgi:aminoglycoside 6-adenylyltransferase
MDASSVIARITDWATDDENVRAVLLTSSQVSGDTDALSDFDVELYVSDPAPFLGEPDWQVYLGDVLVRLPPEAEDRDANQFGRLVIHADGTKVDYSIYRVQVLEEMVRSQRLHTLLELGYRVLLDRDGLAARLPAPSYRAEISSKPTEQEFADTVEEFFWETTYVAKNLRRGELWPWKYSLESVMKLELLRRILEWRVEIAHGWSLRAGVLGRRLKRHLDGRTWGELERTFVGAGVEENWTALFATIGLFRRVAREVARELGYGYPQSLDDRVSSYLRKVRALERLEP